MHVSTASNGFSKIHYPSHIQTKARDTARACRVEIIDVFDVRFGMSFDLISVSHLVFGEGEVYALDRSRRSDPH